MRVMGERNVREEFDAVITKKSGGVRAEQAFFAGVFFLLMALLNTGQF